MLRLGLPGGDHGRQEFTECCGLTCIALAEIESQRTYLLNRIDVPRRTRGASPARTDPTTLFEHECDQVQRGQVGGRAEVGHKFA